ncbi:MAG: hypothetical protein CVT49_09675 [candidate division Zixibacteria bacterium HGW-Zixibacteria-1]|nr:MAG: hypothetical protein CVT49_09675 [candidate division Zixibacteria bacterium HGW-Zixibacteria-1]
MRYFNHTKILRILILAMLMTLVYQVSFAVNIRGRERRHVNNPKDLWAFQVAFDEKIDDDNDEFDGIRFSMMRQYSDYSGVRFNLGFMEQAQDYSPEKLYISDGLAFSFNRNHSFDLSGVNMSMQYMFTPRSHGSVNFFWGLGPRLSVEEASSDIAIAYYDAYPDDWLTGYECKSNTLVGLGVEGSVGMEWFLARNFSMLLEYGFTFQNQWYIFDLDYYTADNYVISEVTAFDDGVHFDASRIKLGVAVYF